ncbi:DUF3099 domain-containing protein [Staphylococcus chromogenes]|nr:DUF3099 domain-containing protein [Staphylococcus chromogenes]
MTSANNESHDQPHPGVPQPGRHGIARAFRRPRAALITDAKRSPLENWAHRKRVYNILQGSRIPFLLASAVTYMYLHNVWLSVILFTISIPLPWIAVVIANGQGEPKDVRTKQTYKPQVARQLHRDFHQQLDQPSRPALPGTDDQTIIDHDD